MTKYGKDMADKAWEIADRQNTIAKITSEIVRAGNLADIDINKLVKYVRFLERSLYPMPTQAQDAAIDLARAQHNVDKLLEERE